MSNLLIFFTGTFAIMLFSWFLSIKHKRFHGVPRFFSFQMIFLLAWLNYKYWFLDPLCPAQIISWIFLTCSLVIAIYAYLLLVKFGKPGRNFETTTRLVTTGIYHYIRHPMYASLLYLGIGLYLKHPADKDNAFMAVMNVVSLVMTVRIEEDEMLKKFGYIYQDYMTKSKMFIPFVV